MAKGKKTGGRTKGSTNKATKARKERIERVLAILDRTIDEDIKNLEPKERVRLWSDIQEYVRPKLARVETTVHGTIELTDVSKTQFKLVKKQD